MTSDAKIAGLTPGKRYKATVEIMQSGSRVPTFESLGWTKEFTVPNC